MLIFFKISLIKNKLTLLIVYTVMSVLFMLLEILLESFGGSNF